jgi:hypothetical protein
MNLRSLNNMMSGMANNIMAGIFRQTCHAGVLSSTYMKPLSVRAGFCAAFLALASLFLSSGPVRAQTNYYATNGTEYAVIGSLPGDQMFSDVAISPAGGFVVWQDNITDGDGWGISARKLDNTLSGTLGTFRVNTIGAGNQERPHVALLKNGGAVFVWQGGKLGFQHIWARFLNVSNTFINANDVQVNTFSNNFQINPAVTVLNNSNVVVVWSSFDQAGSNSLQDVYAQILSPAGQKIGGEFLLNQFTTLNQRSPAVAALPGGGFIATWVSEQERIVAPVLGTNFNYTSASGVVNPSADVYARTFDANGNALGNEFLVNADSNPCTAPAVAVATDGSYLIAWTAYNLSNPTNSFDVYGRTFTSGGSGGSVLRINTHVYGDQYVPRVAALGLDYLVTWTSLAQDGSREGVYGQFVHSTGSLTGSELRMNTTTAGQQMQPAVASDSANQFIVTWSSFTGLPNEFDLYAQRYLNVSSNLLPMPAPFVWAPFVVSNGVYQPQLVVCWTPLLGLSISNYEVFANGGTTPMGLTTSNQWTMTAANGLSTNTTVSFQVSYVTTDGRTPTTVSPPASGTTWSGLNWGGIPYEWMAAYYGGYINGKYYTNNWPLASSSLGQRLTLYGAFVSGANPYDSSTWLKTQFTSTAEGMFLSWNTQPGATYQVQVSTDLKTWNNSGAPRFAAGTSDSIYIGSGNPAGYYQVILMR